MAKREQFPDRSGVYYTKPPVKIYVVGSAVAVSAFTLIVLALMFPWWFAAGGALVLAGVLGWLGIVVLDTGASTYHKIAMQKYDRQRARYHTIPRTESIIDLCTGTIHAPAIGAGGPVVVDGQAVEVEQRQPPRQLADVVGRAKKHIATLGATQAGKTSTMLHITDMLYSRYGDAAAIACDPHANETDWPSFVQVVQSYEDITATLDWLFNEMLKRQQPGAERGQPIILMIDELPAVMDEAADMGVNAKRFIKRLSREGWKFNIYLVLATQTGTVEDLGLNASVRENFTWIKLDERDTQRNQATIVEYRHFKPIELINLCGPYHAHGGRWFSAARPALSLPQPVEVEPDGARLCPVCAKQIESSRAKYCSQACRQKAYLDRRDSMTDDACDG